MRQVHESLVQNAVGNRVAIAPNAGKSQRNNAHDKSAHGQPNVNRHLLPFEELLREIQKLQERRAQGAAHNPQTNKPG